VPDIFLQQLVHSVGVSARQQIRAQVFRANRVGLFRLVVLSLVIPANCHRKAECDDQAEKRERCGYHGAQVLSIIFVYSLQVPATDDPNLR